MEDGDAGIPALLKRVQATLESNRTPYKANFSSEASDELTMTNTSPLFTGESSTSESILRSRNRPHRSDFPTPTIDRSALSALQASPGTPKKRTRPNPPKERENTSNAPAKDTPSQPCIVLDGYVSEKLDYLQKDLTSEMERRKRAEQMTDEVTAELKRVKEESYEKDTAIRRLKDQAETLQAKLDGFQSLAEEKLALESQLKDANHLLESDRHMSYENMAQLTRRTTELEVTSGTMAAELEAARAKYLTADDERVELRARLAKLTGDYNTLRHKAFELEIHNTELSAELSATQKQVWGLTSPASQKQPADTPEDGEKDKTIAQLTKDLAHARAELRTYEEVSVTTSKDLLVHRLREQRGRQADLSNAKAERARLEEENGRLRAALLEVRQEVDEVKRWKDRLVVSGWGR
ncbi:Chromosome partition protein Smc [Carpediemonas membranifera]|uniref:Chromosome partition protein Smc n=1 Tax=Carpediemonas membranifera TaxID=201153 RepID=A0A8J6E9E1_9EUKA|nr:Chromosome partition protein Smc [Carpediemonas membranifera]|eukprot:KAG9393205.1 Chromosome partition protein Smc [Carpediemonas membranifera]